MTGSTTVWISLATLLLFPPTNCQLPGPCKTPIPSSNFTLDGFYGRWYGVGRYRTAGGANYDDECVCTTVDVQAKKGASAPGDSTAIYSCRKNSFTGETFNATGHLTEMDKPGHWKEKFTFFTRPVNYTLVYMDKDFAVEYDCGEHMGKTNYCIYVLARSPTPNYHQMLHLAVWTLFQGLNPADEPFLLTNQTKCW